MEEFEGIRLSVRDTQVPPDLYCFSIDDLVFSIHEEKGRETFREWWEERTTHENCGEFEGPAIIKPGSKVIARCKPRLEIDWKERE
jgi:hypothetical protein